MDVILEGLFVGREVCSAVFSRVCEQYRLTMTELLVLLFLADNAEPDTAHALVEKLKIAKSHVSSSVHDLEKRGYLVGHHTGKDHKTIHLRLCPAAEEIVREARAAQRMLRSILTRGFDEAEQTLLLDFLRCMIKNGNDCLHGQPGTEEQA